MKLLRAEFQNFRLLRDLELNFSSDADRKLTVIRAANESGKTTILHALQWALYGDPALPGKGEDFRLHPIDWSTNSGQHVPITATVEFESTTYRRMSSGKIRETRHHYRLIRSTFEDIDSSTRRSTSTVQLFELKDSGASPINEPAAIINEELPPELREVFFTDGDSALSFIEADVTLATKRERVQRAIRSLLGLGVIKDAIKHVKKSSSETNRKAKNIGNSGELDEVTSSLEELENNYEELEAKLEDAKQQCVAFDQRYNEMHRRIETALQKGNKEVLQKKIEETRQEIKQLDVQILAASKEHSALLQSEAIAIDLLMPTLSHTFERLDELHDQGKIPNMTIPVLQDRLTAGICICGETLKSDDKGGAKRQEHIQKLIDDSQQADEIQEIVTDLYYRTKSPKTTGNSDSNTWPQNYKKVVENRDGLQTLRDTAGRKFRELERELDSLPDTDIQGLREAQRKYKEQYDRHLANKSTFQTQLAGLKRERENFEVKRDRLLREQKKGDQILAELEVTQDITKVLESAYTRITERELLKVSELMNDIFLEMIGSDPEQGAIIQRAEISQEFDIIVYGPNNKTLNPDRDLNGASRRALTLAFILALTKVSEVEAPNVIDTPLGMTSGYVKRSMLQTAVRESTQLILFLTHDEIIGCEEIINQAAGDIYTLTNPTHYPKMLVNNPGSTEQKILRCECDHQNECSLCQRRIDLETELNMAT